MSADDLITCAQVYLSVGAVVWLVLDGLGIIDNTFAARSPVSRPAMVLATAMMILAWPVFVYTWLRGMWRISR